MAHLDTRASEEDVRTLFSAHGAVMHVRIIQDRESGQSKGYGFVTMGAPNMAQVDFLLLKCYYCLRMESITWHVLLRTCLLAIVR